ncbi:hypothetical protein ACH5RR_018473 [Cinchona calisaya]|uniref:Uncharacterized protein n=1 Tax=Cinchona calisaya TaxID=153742 RepID=A0ABD2ZMF7_9GENT
MLKCLIALPLLRRRGITRNLSLTKKRDAKEVLASDVNDNVRRIVGKDSQHFITKSGCVLRKLAKLNVQKLSKLSDKEREDLITLNMIKDHSQRQFLRYSTKEEAMEHVLEGVSHNDWIWLYDYFSSAQFQPCPSKSQAANFQLFRAEIEKHMKRADAAEAASTIIVEQFNAQQEIIKNLDNNKEKQKCSTSSLLRK